MIELVFGQSPDCARVANVTGHRWHWRITGRVSRVTVLFVGLWRTSSTRGGKPTLTRPGVKSDSPWAKCDVVVALHVTLKWQEYGTEFMKFKKVSIQK